MKNEDAAPASAPSPKQGITPRALLDTKRLSDPQIHPDGRRIAFVVTEADFDESRWVSHIWLTEWEEEGSADDAPTRASSPDEEDAAPSDPSDLTRQLTYSHEGEMQPRWSPDGRYLALLSARPDHAAPLPDDEEEETEEQIWLLPIDGGEARKLTDAKEGIQEYAWMPDASAIVYLAPEPRARPVENIRSEQRDRRKIDPTVEPEERLRRQFWRIDVDGRKPKLLYTADGGVSEFALSPDGVRLCYTTNHTGDPNDYHQVDLYLLDMQSGESACLCDRAGGKYEPLWSPDGAQIACLSWLEPTISYSRECLLIMSAPEPGAMPRHTVDCETLEVDYDYDLAGFRWLWQDRRLYALAHVRTGSEIVRIDLETRAVTRLDLDGAADRHDLALNPESGVMAWVQEAANSLPEIALRDEEGAVHMLTRLNADFADAYLLPHQEVVRWHSPDDLEIEGVLTYPLDYQAGDPVPLIVQVHGGPKSRARNTIRDYSMPPVWAAAGYAVLRPNFRGSEGYGNAFALSNRRDLGGGDFNDIMAGVDYLIARGIADAGRLGVMGGSYGGYMTNWIIGHTDRFAAAISMFGIFHLQTDYSNSSLSRWENDYLGAYYWEDPEAYRRMSPGSYLERIKTPTLILHGDDDDNTSASNSRELYQALRHRGITVQFVHYPREGHGLSEPNHRLDEMRRCLAWMDRYVLRAGEAPAIYRPGDRALSPDKRLELCVSRAEPAEFVGQKADGGDTPALLMLEVVFTLHSPPGQTASAPYALSFAAMRLEAPPGQKSLLPAGVPLDLHGVKSLVEGDDLHLVHYPDLETGQIAFAAAVVFRVPKSGGEGLLRVADFPPVQIAWVADEEDEAATAAEDPGETG